MATVAVDADALRKLLDSVRDTARAIHARCDRKTRTYPFDDEIWKKADPHEFGLYDNLRKALDAQ